MWRVERRVSGCDVGGGVAAGCADAVMASVAGAFSAPGEQIAETLEALLLDKVTCSGIARPSTMQRLRGALAAPDAGMLAELLLNPADLASVVARGGLQLEGAVVVAQNLRLLVDSGAGADLLAHGWDGVRCDEPQTIACTAGTVTSTVGCTAGIATDIVLAFDSCVVQGEKKQGVVAFTRDLDDDSAAVDVALVEDETRVVDGGFLLDVGHAGAFMLALSDGFAVVDHGGRAGGLSCSAETRLTDASFDLDDDTATITLALSHDTPETHLAMATTSPVVFDGRCGCPQPGSGIVIDVPRPLGRDGETARARITWSESDNDDACAQAHVTLTEWPTDCAIGGDCAKAVTAATITTLLTAFCFVQ